jgi:hypothetical protein
VLQKLTGSNSGEMERGGALLKDWPERERCRGGGRTHGQMGYKKGGLGARASGLRT